MALALPVHTVTPTLKVQPVWVLYSIKARVFALFRTYTWVKHIHCSPPIFVRPLSIQGKRLPAYLSADAEEGEVSDDDSADEIEDDFKLRSSNVRVRNVVNIMNAQTCANTSNRHGTSHYLSHFSRCVDDFRS